jgi:hypothetical protein
MNEYSITLFEACEYLNKSQKTLSRYIRKGRITPLEVKSKQGTLAYRFSKVDLEALKLELEQESIDEARQDRQDTPDQTRQDIPAFEKAHLSTKTKINQEQTRQDRADRTEQTGHPESIISLLKDTTELLKGQLAIKDSQIGTLNEQVHKLIERDRETNILLKGLQDRVMLLGPPDKPGQYTRKQIIKRILLLIILLITLGVAVYFNVLPMFIKAGQPPQQAIVKEAPAEQGPELTERYFTDEETLLIEQDTELN